MFMKNKNCMILRGYKIQIFFILLIIIYGLYIYTQVPVKIPIIKPNITIKYGGKSVPKEYHYVEVE